VTNRGRKTVLVTGGAGYIGSHTCRLLRQAGYLPVSFDNLSSGRVEAVRFGPLVMAELGDRQALDTAFAQHEPTAVIHFAAISSPPGPGSPEAHYRRINVEGTRILAEAAAAAGCQAFIHASTGAVYGDHGSAEVDEESECRPDNPYACSKQEAECVLDNYHDRHGLRVIHFRCFNVAGAEPGSRLGQFHSPQTHLVPCALEVAASRREVLYVHGDDYDTADGTCIRDYVHVSDVARAHLLGLRWLEAGKPGGVFNLGTGSGHSVRQIIDRCSAVTGKPIPCIPGPRRPGESPRLVSGSKRAQRELGWRVQHSQPERIIEHAWESLRRHHRD
jgi:UDP-glucose 4-epimerase